MEEILPLLEETLAKNQEDPDSRKPSPEKMKDYATGNQIGKSGKYWRGRRPKDGDFTEVEKLIVESDQISSCIRTQRGGVVGRDFEWGAIIPGGTTNEEGETVDLGADGEGAPTILGEIQAAMSKWHRQSNLHRIAKDFETARYWGGYATLRVYIPRKWRDVAYRGSCKTLEEALELINIQALDRLQSGPIEDEHGMVVGFYYDYNEKVEVTGDGDGSKQHYRDQRFIELHTPHWIFILREEGGKWFVNDSTEGNPWPNPLFDETKRRRPNFMLQTADREDGSVITAGLVDKQDSLNEEYVYMKRGSSQLGGYRSIMFPTPRR